MVAAIDCRLLAALLAVAAPVCAQSVGGTVAVTSAKVFRGLDQGGDHPGLLIDAGWRNDAGWALAAGAARAGPFSEVTLAASRGWQADPDWTAQAGVVHYAHPDGSERFVPDYDEAWLAAGWRGRVYASLALSPDTAGRKPGGERHRGAAAAVEITLHQPLAAGFAFDAGAGWYEVRAAGRGYAYGSAGLAWADGPLVLALGWIGSSASRRGVVPPGVGANLAVATALLRF